MLPYKKLDLIQNLQLEPINWVLQHKYYVYNKEKSLFIFRDGDCIIKTQMKGNDIPALYPLMNEAFVGLFGINKMIGTPYENNFAKIVGFNKNYNCNRDLHKESERPDRDVQFDVVYEYIHNSISFTDFLFLKSTTEEKVIKVLGELFGALKYAYNTIGFTHYDFHTNNVLMTKSDTPVIIDYEYSHVFYNKESCGYEFEEVNVFVKPCWQHDVIKFLATILMLIDPSFGKMYQENLKNFDPENAKQDSVIHQDEFIDIIEPKKYNYFPTHLGNLNKKLLSLLSFFCNDTTIFFKTQFLEPPKDVCQKSYSFEKFYKKLLPFNNKSEN